MFANPVKLTSSTKWGKYSRLVGVFGELRAPDRRRTNRAQRRKARQIIHTVFSRKVG